MVGGGISIYKKYFMNPPTTLTLNICIFHYYWLDLCLRVKLEYMLPVVIYLYFLVFSLIFQSMEVVGDGGGATGLYVKHNLFVTHKWYCDSYMVLLFEYPNQHCSWLNG